MKTVNVKKQRKSNIELLRIIAMLMIIDVHYFASCDAANVTIAWSGNWVAFHILESAGICGVNIFILITGFFSLQQDSIYLRKIVNLLVDVAFWGGLGFFLCVLVGWKSFSVKELNKLMFPLLFGGRWFVKAYIVLLCLIPFINLVLRALTKKSYQKLLIIMIALFSLWPSFLPHPPLDDYGYGFVHFVLLYLIAGYIRLHVQKYPPRWMCLLGYFISASVVCVSSMIGDNYSWAYNNIFVIVEAVFLLLFFLQLNIQATLINRVAACAFGVFLIHTDGFFSRVIYDILLRCNDLCAGSNFVLFLISALISLPAFYFVGYYLESAKKRLFSVSVDQLLDMTGMVNNRILVKTNNNGN